MTDLDRFASQTENTGTFEISTAGWRFHCRCGWASEQVCTLGEVRALVRRHAAGELV